MVQDNEPDDKGLGRLLRSGQARPILGGLVAIAVIFILILAIAFSGGGGGDEGGTPGESLHAGLATSEPTPEATIDLNRQVITEPRSVNLTQLGPEDRLLIPKIGVDAVLALKSVGADGQMPDPETPDEITYYDFSAWPGMGGAPGRGGNGVFSGHVDSGRKACKNGTVKPPCQAVLWDLRTLKAGDEIQVRVGGQTHTYQVKTNEPVNAATGPWGQIVASTVQESITLITCGGQFVAGEYTNRQVVTAVRV